MENVSQQESINQPLKGSQVSSWKGLIQVFYQPSQLFAGIKENPKILVPWIVFFAAIFVSFFLTADLIAKVQMEIMKEKMAEQGTGAGGPMPTLEMMKYSIIGFGAIFSMLSPLVAAGLAMFFGNFMMAGRANLKQILSVMLYGEIIYAVGFLIVAPLMLAKNSLMVSFSLAALFKNLTIQDPTYVALSKIGLFYIWEIVVIGIGLSIIYGFARNKGYLLAVLSMGMLSILHVLIQFAFGGM